MSFPACYFFLKPGQMDFYCAWELNVCYSNAYVFFLCLLFLHQLMKGLARGKLGLGKSQVENH